MSTIDGGDSTCDGGRVSEHGLGRSEFHDLTLANNSGTQSRRKERKTYAHLRPVPDLDDFSAEPLRYAQSNSGQASSQLTFPSLSRSMETASDSLHVRVPYATLRRWPGVVPHRSAKSSRSITLRDFQKLLRSMPQSHQMVIQKAIPSGVFTKWCTARDNFFMSTPTQEEIRKKLHEVRRANLREYCRRYRKNKSDLARMFSKAFDTESVSTSMFSEILKEGSTKSFGEVFAYRLEHALRLKQGQLSIPKSPLELEAKSALAPLDELQQVLSDVSEIEVGELIDALRAIRNKHKGPRQKAS